MGKYNGITFLQRLLLCVPSFWFSSLFLISCCAPLLYWFPLLSSSHTGLLRPLLLLVFYHAYAFNQDLSSWNVAHPLACDCSKGLLDHRGVR